MLYLCDHSLNSLYFLIKYILHRTPVPSLFSFTTLLVFSGSLSHKMQCIYRLINLVQGGQKNASVTLANNEYGPRDDSRPQENNYVL